MMRRLLAGLCIAAGAALVSASQVLPPSLETETPIPEHYELVNDQLVLLRMEQAVALTARLQELERANGTQIVLLTVPSVGRAGACDYARRVFERWNIGNNGQGNGVLILISGAQGYCLSTGAGIGGALPDVTVARILRHVLAPAFDREQYDEGLLATVDALIAAARSEDTAPTFFDYSPSRADLFWVFDIGSTRYAVRKALVTGLLVAAFVLYIVVLGRRRFGRTRGAA